MLFAILDDGCRARRSNPGQCLKGCCVGRIQIDLAGYASLFVCITAACRSGGRCTVGTRQRLQSPRRRRSVRTAARRRPVHRGRARPTVLRLLRPSRCVRNHNLLPVVEQFRRVDDPGILCVAIASRRPDGVRDACASGQFVKPRFFYVSMYINYNLIPFR